MTTLQFDNMLHAKPFRPFVIHLADGTRVPVRHPELVFRTEGGRTVVVNTGGEELAILDLLLVTQLTHLSVRSKRNGRT